MSRIMPSDIGQHDQHDGVAPPGVRQRGRRRPATARGAPEPLVVPAPPAHPAPARSAPALLVADAVAETEAGFVLTLPGRPPLKLMRGIGQVRQFDRGWTAESLVTLLHPFWLLVMRHRDGAVGWWAVRDNGMVCSRPREQSEPVRRAMRALLLPIAAWLDMARDAPIRLSIPAQARALLDLPAPARQVLGEAAAELDIRLRLDAFADTPPGPAPMAENGADGSIVIRQGGTAVPLMADGAPTTLAAGWHVEQLSLAAAPVLCLALRHQDNSRATWLADLHGERIGHHPTALQPRHADYLSALLAPMFDALWQRFVLARDVPVTDAVAMLDALPPEDMATLVAPHLAARGLAGDSHVWNLEQGLPEGAGFVVPTASGPRLLLPARVLAGLQRPLQEENDRLIATGRMRWPSPIDDRELESDGEALLMHRFTFAYRFRHPDGMVFYAICQGGHFKTAALYFPQIDLVVAEERFVLHEVLDVWGIFRRGREAMLHHVTRFGAVLARGETLPPDRHLQCFFGASGNHIGHYIWQELCGLAYMLERHPGSDRLPQLHLFADPNMTQYCGPIEQIFPAFQDRVTHHPVPFDPGLADFYRRNQRVIKYTATTVPVSLGYAVRAAAEAEPSLAAERRRADRIRRTAHPLIVVGLRVGVRKMVDQDSFYAELLERLKQRYPDCAVVLDGLNDVADRGRAVAGTPNQYVAEEFALADGLARKAAALDLPLIDLINRSTLCSVLWCARADAFFAPLGAALAKYRWICNTPGMVVTSLWNIVERFDLHIYDFPEWMDEPTETIFNTAAETTDIVREGSSGVFDGQSNYTLEREPVFARFMALLERHRRSGAGARGKRRDATRRRPARVQDGPRPGVEAGLDSMP